MAWRSREEDRRSRSRGASLSDLELEGSRIARQGTPVAQRGLDVGEITSGTFSPTLQKSIAMAYVDAASAGGEPQLSVDLKSDDDSREGRAAAVL